MQEVKTQELTKEINPVLVQAQHIEVDTPETYNSAADFLKELKSAQKKVTDWFGPMKKKAHEAWKSITTREKEVLEPLQQAEQQIKGKMIVWKQEQDRKRREEERKLQAEAEERARRERERLRKKAEKLKTPEKQEEYRRAADEVQVPVVTVQSEVPKASGISTRKIWKAKIANKKAFIQAAINDENLLAFITLDESALNRVAQATKGKISYPGIEFYEHETMAAGGKS